MERPIIQIDEDLCDGCGECVPSCAEGAIQVIDGKARLVKDALCDGLGACLGDCPQGALTVITRDADEFDEALVEEHLAATGTAGGRDHDHDHDLDLDHGHAHAHAHGHGTRPTDHGPRNTEHGSRTPAPGNGKLGIRAMLGLAPARPAPADGPGHGPGHGPAAGGGCPGARMMQFDDDEPAADAGAAPAAGPAPSQLRQWPIQMHLISPQAPYFHDADVLLAADCCAFAVGGFHSEHLKGHSLAIACPKLDSDQQIYLDKLVSMIDDANIRTLTVMVMQVPCCSGLSHLAQQAVASAHRKVPIRQVVVGLRGEILTDQWL